MNEATVERILDFWFGSLGPQGEVDAAKKSRWWKKSDEFDALCRKDFAADLALARAGEIVAPKSNPRGALAFIVLCDQLSRNMYRDTPDAFATDALALAVTLDLIDSGELNALAPIEKSFALMPLMHSEELSIHEISMTQFTKLKKENVDNLGFAERHKTIIEKFGRYPHRNSILGRESTPEERAFLRQPGSSF